LHIHDWVRAATVIITAVTEGGVREPIGSGFFVAPGWVVSCAHVVVPAVEPHVHWRGHDLTPLAIHCAPGERSADGRFAFPDAAALLVPVPAVEPPSVPIGLTPPVPGHPVWALGITGIRSGRLENYAARLTIADAEPGGLFRLQDGQLGLGMSGGPVLDLLTYEVIGVTKSIQDEDSALGGWAIPIAAALAVAPVPLAQLNADYHTDSLKALRDRQVPYGRLPRKVQSLLVAHPGVVDLLTDQLSDLRMAAPVLVSPGDVAEWNARRLFDLDLDQLVTVLMAIRDNLGVETTLTIFDNVACCLAVEGYPDAWVAAEAALSLRAEADRDQPRIVRVCTEMRQTVRMLMRRAFEEKAGQIFPVAGPDDGAPGGSLSHDDILSELRRRSGDFSEREWAALSAEDRARAMRTFRVRNDFFTVRTDTAPDAVWLRQLVARFPGLRLLIASRQMKLPAGIDDVLLNLVPPIDRTSEQAGTTNRDWLEMRT
jgi:Trypsin-like peptidase domain